MIVTAELGDLNMVIIRKQVKDVLLLQWEQQHKQKELI